MPASFSLTLSFPLPPSIPPNLVVQTLHAHEPLIRPNPYLQGFRRLPVDMDEVVSDPFFTSSVSSSSSPPTLSLSFISGGVEQQRAQPSSPPRSPDGIIASYEIHDRIPVVGFMGIYKDTIFPAIFQNTPRGVRVKVEAAMGVKVRSIYEVCRRTTTTTTTTTTSPNEYYYGNDGSTGEGGGGLLSEWELVERSQVECGALLKPFVMKQFEAGHRDLCRKVLDGIVDGRNKELPPLPDEVLRGGGGFQ